MKKLMLLPLCSLLVIMPHCSDGEAIVAEPTPAATTSAATSAGAAGAGSAGAAGSAQGGADDGPGSPASCSRDRPGPAMVSVSTPDGHRYCIDTTEVTQGHYAEFRAKVKLAEANMPKELCQHLRELAPPKPLTPASDPTCESTYHPDKTPHSPMVCVDWCSAHAYCAWAGKRLCGQVGGAMMVEEKLDNADSDEWYNACSNGGKTAYPYGDTFDMAACWAETPLEGKLPDDPAEPALGIYPRYPAVGERPTCRGVEPPFSGIFDMSMGVGEWMNGCWPGGSSGDMSCALRGGSYASPPERTSCKHSSSTSQYVAYHWIGFRCCADLAAERERRHGGRTLSPRAVHARWERGLGQVFGGAVSNCNEFAR